MYSHATVASVNFGVSGTMIYYLPCNTHVQLFVVDSHDANCSDKCGRLYVEDFNLGFISRYYVIKAVNRRLKDLGLLRLKDLSDVVLLLLLE